jgi:hypothetical protein
MRLAFLIVGLLLFATIGMGLAATPSDGVQTLGPADNVAALEAAYRHMARSRVESTDQVVILRRIRHFVVVTFIEPCSLEKRCYGGRMHVVYDPAARKVVYVRGEQ